jgi:hypothetical protein
MMTQQPSPAAVDLRSVFSPVHDQGQRGTCLAFAVTAAHEVSRTSVAPPEDLSEDALYWGCKRTDGNWSRGTSFRSAGTAISAWGQPTELVWPYDPRQPDEAPYHPPTPPGGDGWVRTGLRGVAAGSDEVRSQLDAGAPVALGLTLFDTFFRPTESGRIEDPPAGAPTRGRHAVVAVGHQPAEILIRNSWGTTWGLGGYAWISDGYVETYASEAWVIDASHAAGGGGGAHTSNTPETTYGSR